MMDVHDKRADLSWITKQATRNHTSVLSHCTSNNAEAANDTKVGAASGTGGTEVCVLREHFGELFVELLLFSGQKAVKKTDFHQENVLSLEEKLLLKSENNEVLNKKVKTFNFV